MCNLLWIMSYAHRRQIFKKFLYPLDRSLLIGIFFVCRQQFWLWKTSEQTSSDIKLNEFNQKNILRTCENSEYDRRPPSSIIGASKRQNLCLHFTIWTEKGLHKPVCHTVVWSLSLFYKAPVCYFLCNQRKKNIHSTCAIGKFSLISLHLADEQILTLRYSTTSKTSLDHKEAMI